jgi:hypothetical protein
MKCCRLQKKKIICQRNTFMVILNVWGCIRSELGRRRSRVRNILFKEMEWEPYNGRPFAICMNENTEENAWLLKTLCGKFNQLLFLCEYYNIEFLRLWIHTVCTVETAIVKEPFFKIFTIKSQLEIYTECTRRVVCLCKIEVPRNFIENS